MRSVSSALWRVRGLLRTRGHAPIFDGPARNGTFQEFLARLLAVESGIDPARLAEYVRDYESPVVRYPRVTSPGRLIRDSVTGGPQFEQMTVAQYFTSLGVRDLFDPTSAASLRAMQYASMNALGFIGYQFGESALIDSGHYRPETVELRDRRGRKSVYQSYYFGSVTEATWRNGRTQVVHRMTSTKKVILATDVNRWRGTFTGKHGIFKLADLKDPECQELLIRDHLQANHTLLVDIFSRRRAGVRSMRGTWSGLLAAAHLCGPYAVAAFVLDGKNAEDEFHTNIRTYISEFGGFETPYDTATSMHYRAQPAT